jgi:hypothetical protein
MVIFTITKHVYGIDWRTDDLARVDALLVRWEGISHGFGSRSLNVSHALHDYRNFQSFCLIEIGRFWNI